MHHEDSCPTQGYPFLNTSIIQHAQGRGRVHFLPPCAPKHAAQTRTCDARPFSASCVSVASTDPGSLGEHGSKRVSPSGPFLDLCHAHRRYSRETFGTVCRQSWLPDSKHGMRMHFPKRYRPCQVCRRQGAYPAHNLSA